MQYHIQTLVKHLFDKDSFEQVSEQELKQFTEAYPYAAVGQFLYAKKLHDAGAYNQHEQGEHASLYFHNSLWMRWLLNQQYEAAPVETMRAEEPAQQQAYRIVVQMPKQPVSAPLVAEAPEIAEETIQPEATAAIEAPAVLENENGQPVTELPAPEENPVPEMPETPVPAEEPEADSTLVESAPEAEKAPESPAEAVSAVAIAENSLLAGETIAGSVVNAVSITKEVIAVGTAAPEPEVAGTLEEQPPVEIPGPAPHAEEPPAIEPPVAEPVEQETAAPEAETQQQEEEKNEEVEEVEEAEASYSPASIEVKAAVDSTEPIFESYHTIDYFASQGIKLRQEEYKDRLGKQLKSFTEWLRSMKRIAPTETNTSIDEITNRSIQRIAENSVTEKEVITEAMAEVWAKQGHPEKAIVIYEKLSLQNPAKRTYFAGRIEQLKAL